MGLVCIMSKISKCLKYLNVVREIVGSFEFVSMKNSILSNATI